MSKKLALVIGYGQSNERGTGVAPRLAGTAILNSDVANNVRHQGIFGTPSQSLTTTAPYVEPCSMFQKLAEAIAIRTGWTVSTHNFAKGGSSVTDSWCGWDAGNSRVKVFGDAGYDPNTYIAPMIAKITSLVAQGVEVWTFTAGHQQDLVVARPVAQIISASAEIQTRSKAAGASKVFVGKTARYISGASESEWDAGGKIHQIADGVVAAVPGAFVGADLSADTDTSLRATDDLQYIHLNHAGVCWAAEKWFDVLKAGSHV